MSKLFKLKKWMSISDTAVRLSTIFGEKVGEADVLRLALDGHLKLSVQLVNGAYGRYCAKINADNIKWDEMPSLDGVRTVRIPIGGRIWSDAKGTFQVTEGVTRLEEGIWDLPLTGGERVDIEYEYQKLTNGPEVTGVTIEGVFVASETGGLYEIQAPFEFNSSELIDKQKQSPTRRSVEYYPAGALPEDSVLVVRTDALRQLEQNMSETSELAEKPLTTRERHTLLTILAALAQEANINISTPSKAAVVIENLTTRRGTPVSKRAIEEHLKKIPDALESRTK